jgi:hypothetical protein
MSRFEDLSEYVYSTKFGRGIVNVGWLDLNRPFSRGEVDSEILARLGDLCKNPVNRMRGWHACGMCPDYPVRERIGTQLVTLGDAEIHIPGRSKVYACPTLIYHYIARHNYNPPAEFLEAVRDSQNK